MLKKENNMNLIIKSTKNVETMDYSGPIGELFEQCGLPKADEYVAYYTLPANQFNDVPWIEQIEIQTTNKSQVIWNTNKEIDLWTDKDDVITEAAESFADAEVN
jgi:hypothetical protein|tara:strand:- start:220 stop:531 length:312 start_codon:yes stop_codon:yes gene_type:complete